jgi:hypothetical protein
VNHTRAKYKHNEKKNDCAHQGYCWFICTFFPQFCAKHFSFCTFVPCRKWEKYVCDMNKFNNRGRKKYNYCQTVKLLVSIFIGVFRFLVPLLGWLFSVYIFMLFLFSFPIKLLDNISLQLQRAKQKSIENYTNT